MLNRTISKTIKEINDSFPVLLLTGPRQVGKTTILQMCADNNFNYVTLDDLEIRHLAQNDPSLFIQTYQYPLIIDEVQYAPELLSYIKITIDKEQKNGMFWLTGSQKFHLMKGINESLAGRIAIIDLLGFSTKELEGKGNDIIPFNTSTEWIAHAKKLSQPKTLLDIYKTIWLGSFPRVNIYQTQRDIFYRSYIQTYITRDVKDILNISDENSFYKFIRAVAARTGQLLNYADLARDVGIDNKTIKSWISVLETSGLLYLLQPYYNNITKRIIKAPKLYFLDTGLCSYLTKWSSPESLEAGSMSGAILETYVFSEILKSYWHNGMEGNLYYYRDADQKEIDLIIESDDTLYPVEFKKTGSPSRAVAKTFHLPSKFGKKVGHGFVLCFVDREIPLSQSVTAVPIRYL